MEVSGYGPIYKETITEARRNNKDSLHSKAIQLFQNFLHNNSASQNISTSTDYRQIDSELGNYYMDRWQDSKDYEGVFVAAKKGNVEAIFTIMCALLGWVTTDYVTIFDLVATHSVNIEQFLQILAQRNQDLSHLVTIVYRYTISLEQDVDPFIQQLDELIEKGCRGALIQKMWLMFFQDKFCKMELGEYLIVTEKLIKFLETEDHRDLGLVLLAALYLCSSHANQNVQEAAYLYLSLTANSSIYCMRIWSTLHHSDVVSPPYLVQRNVRVAMLLNREIIAQTKNATLVWQCSFQLLKIYINENMVDDYCKLLLGLKARDDRISMNDLRVKERALVFEAHAYFKDPEKNFFDSLEIIKKPLKKKSLEAYRLLKLIAQTYPSAQTLLQEVTHCPVRKDGLYVSLEKIAPQKQSDNEKVFFELFSEARRRLLDQMCSDYGIA